MRTFFIGGTLTLLCLTPFLGAQTAPAVPSQFQSAYTTLNSDLNNFGASLNSTSAASSSLLYSSQLQTATSDVTTKLLDPNYYQVAVLSELNSLEALGVKAVTFHINFPSIYQPYVNNAGNYQGYINFYTQLVTEVHSRGLKVIIENTSGVPFPGTNSAEYAPYLHTLDWPTYQRQRAEFAAMIASTFQPDYMVLVAEPDTEASTTGQPNAGTVAGSTQMLRGMITAIQNAGATNVQLSAGCGTWNSSFLQFIQSFVTLPLSLIDMHVYPVNRNNLPNAQTAVNMIEAAGKQPTMSELWTYKENDTEYAQQNVALTTIFARDVYSFWGSTDINFLNTMARFASSGHFKFISPFWSHYFFAYLDYNSNASASDTSLILAEGNAASQANLAGRFTPTGLAYQNIIVQSQDRTAPQVPAPPAVKNASQTAVSLVWNPTSDNVGVAAYNVYRNNVLIGTVSSPLSFLDSGLTANTTYSYALSAFDAAGNVSPKSAAVTVTTLPLPDRTAPSTPTAPQASSPRLLQMNLTWNASTDNVGVKGYDIYRGTSPSNLTLYGVSAVPSFTDNAVIASKTYYYQVDAYDAAGNHSNRTAAFSAIMPATRRP